MNEQQPHKDTKPDFLDFILEFSFPSDQETLNKHNAVLLLFLAIILSIVIKDSGQSRQELIDVLEIIKGVLALNVIRFCFVNPAWNLIQSRRNRDL